MEEFRKAQMSLSPQIFREWVEWAVELEVNTEEEGKYECTENGKHQRGQRIESRRVTRGREAGERTMLSTNQERQTEWKNSRLGITNRWRWLRRMEKKKNKKQEAAGKRKSLMQSG